MAPIPVPAGVDGGIFNRLEGSCEAIVEKAHLLFREVEITLAENYGVAMPAYLDKLWPRRSSLPSRIRRIIDKFVKKVGPISTPGSGDWLRNLGLF